VTKLKVGLIGAGYLGPIHARLIAGQDVEWTGVFDTLPERREKVATEFGGKPVESVEVLLAGCEAVVVAAATSAHYATAKQALSVGKHVFLEKPITTTPEEGEEIVKLAKSKGLVLQVGHVERFNRAFRALGSDYPQPKFVEAHRLSQFKPRGTDVAVVLDLMIHDLDLILKMMGEYPEKIDASGVAVISEEADIANARLTFPSGGVANVTASRISANPMRKLRMFAADSYIAMDFATGSTQVFRIAHADEKHLPGTMMLGEIDKGAVKRHILMSNPQAPEGNAILMEQEGFFNAIRTGTPPPVTGDDGLNALRVATEILKIMGTTEVPSGRE
jgi:predicted dehydrogenase